MNMRYLRVISLLYKREYMVLLLYCFNTLIVSAQNHVSLNDALEKYVFNTSRVRINRIKLENSILEFSNYKKSFLPSFNISFSPINYNRNLTLLQNYLNGEYSNIAEYTNVSNGGINLSQKIMQTGGVLTIGSSINYLHEFSNNVNSFSTVPLYISYTQSLIDGNKIYKFEKAINEFKMQVLYKIFCMEVSEEQQIILKMYLDAYSGYLDVNFFSKIKDIDKELIEIASKKKESGRITDYEYNQMKLLQLENEMKLQRAINLYNASINDLSAELCIDSVMIDSLKISLMPNIIDEQTVYQYIKANNPQFINLELERMNADYKRYITERKSKFDADISLGFGLNQYSNTFSEAYKNCEKRQSFSISFSFPLFNWGINANSRKIAKNEYEQCLIDIEDTRKQLIAKIREYIVDYNNSICFLSVSEKKHQLSLKQYELSFMMYKNGKISSIELTSAYKESMSAEQEYISSLINAFVNYYRIRHASLHDFVTGQDLIDIYHP